MSALSKPMLGKIATVAVAISLSVSSIIAHAEDGTSGTSPDTLESCAVVFANVTADSSAPDSSPVASPVVSITASPQASPVATPVGSTEATPVGSPHASPVVTSSESVSTETTAPIQSDLEAAASSILTCMSENNVEALISITSPEFRGDWLGFGGDIDDQDFEIILSMMPRLPYALVSVSDASLDGNIATATIEYTVGRHLHTADWTFSSKDVDGNKVWAVETAEAKATTAPVDAETLNLTIDDGSYRFEPETSAASNVVIDVTNVGDQPHEVLVLRVPEGMDANTIAAATTGIPEGSTFIGQATVPAGASGTMVLTGLRPGVYTVVDLLPDENGIPNVSNGMMTTFEVTAP